MKIQIDTVQKTIKVEDNIKFSELIKNLKKLFPNKEWLDFTLETSTVINGWSNPIIYANWTWRPYQYPWYCNTKVTTQNNTLSSGGNIKANSISSNYQLKSGVYNVETK